MRNRWGAIALAFAGVMFLGAVCARRGRGGGGVALGCAVEGGVG
jgi:hypothetical protein